MPSDHQGLKLEISNNRNNRKFTNPWHLDNSLVNVKLGKREIKDFLELNDNKYTAFSN